jgi:hypothetical protein
VKRYEKFKTLTIEQTAEYIVENDLMNNEYCKSDCEDENEICPHPQVCCLRWLNEEVE